MEIPLSFFRMHWDHEPRSRSADLQVGAKASGTGVSPVCRSARSHGRDARATIGRFMESLLSPSRMHWDPEPERPKDK